MTEIAGGSSFVYSHEYLHTGFGSQIGGTLPGLEQGQNIMETVSPEEAAAISTFYNKALMDTDRLRFPVLPSLARPEAAEPACQEDPESMQECSREPEKKHYHGSPEEKVLLARLDNAKGSGDKAAIRKNRENLKSYWRSIIDEDYQSIPRSEFPAEVKKQKKSYKYNPDDSFVQYRLHALAKRAKESGYSESLNEIGRIRNGAWSGTSPTGTKIANYAVDNPKESNFDSYDCYEYVANALDDSGIHLSGRHAYMAADQLASHPKVREIKGLKTEQLPSLPKGAIVVWDKGSGHTSGHISIALGDGNEMSDRKRPQCTEYGTTFRVFMPLDMIEE